MTMVEATREELETLISVLEHEVEGEKLVTRHILEQTRRNSDDLATIKSRLDRFERRFDGLEQRFDDLMRDLPRIVGDVMREVLRERDVK